MKWKVHKHAAEAVKERFGIRPEHVNNFVNQMMEHSVKVHCAVEGREAYAHKTKDFFVAVNPVERIVITVIDKEPEQVSVRTSFFDELLPKMKRELSRMERDYKRKKRAMQKTIAEKTLERGEALIKHAKVYNPATQEIIFAQATSLQLEIDSIEAATITLEVEYNMAHTKLQRFIWTSEA